MTATAQRPAAREGLAPSRPLIGRTALLGLALFVASLGTFAPETAPDPGTATATAVRRFAAENAGILRVNMVATLVSVALLVFFVAALAQQVRDVRRESIGPAVMIALAGVIAAQLLLVAAAASIFGRPEDELADVSDGAMTTLYTVMAVAEWLYTLTILAPCMVLVATYSFFALRYRLVARWVPWAGLVLAAAGALTAVGLALPAIQLDPFLVPLLGWWLWPLAVGGGLCVRWWRTR